MRKHIGTHGGKKRIASIDTLAVLDEVRFFANGKVMVPQKNSLIPAL